MMRKEGEIMTKYTLASIAVLGLMVATSFSALADERDKKTVITTKESIMVPGKVLPPGTYVMKLLESPNRNIVTIFNEKEDQLQTMFIAFPNYKLNRTSDVTLTYWETPAGSPRAIRGWFWPGDNHGQEFAYPKQMAETLSRENNNAKIPSYDAGSDANLSQTDLAKVDVSNQPEASETSTASASASASSTPATVAANDDDRSRAANDDDRSSATRTPYRAETQPAQSSNNTLLAQNTPAPNPVTNDSSSTTNNSSSTTTSSSATTPSELPQTASPLSWILLAGLASFAAAIAVRQLRA